MGKLTCNRIEMDWNGGFHKLGYPNSWMVYLLFISWKISSRQGWELGISLFKDLPKSTNAGCISRGNWAMFGDDSSIQMNFKPDESWFKKTVCAVFIRWLKMMKRIKNLMNPDLNRMMAPHSIFWVVPPVSAVLTILDDDRVMGKHDHMTDGRGQP